MVIKCGHCVVPIICDHCGRKAWSFKSNVTKTKTHFCNLKCYRESPVNKKAYLSAAKNPGRIERMKNRNKTEEMRSKVSRSLLLRKKTLGDQYHSPETLKKIGDATKERWETCKFKILPVLKCNSLASQDRTPYGHSFKVLRRQLAESVDGKCIICQSTNKISGHHILPTRFGGESDDKNIVPLCTRCHKRIETLEWKFFRELKDIGMGNNAWWFVYAYFNQPLQTIMSIRQMAKAA